ncbi:hypothetical protein CRE_16355 [Caenorhabditis remanei]|uniref:Homeobox domain-containing protein n=1 Tax=Caenorhabditis remanei TaxID=31234 RepID=E3NC91_CAERE|nr:hypothetical protein CRE_16355 [Caenorhabditis remanei]
MVRPGKIQESFESTTPKRRISTRRAVPSTPYCLPSSESSDDEAPPPKRKKDLETSQKSSSHRIVAKPTNPEFTEEKLRNILQKFAPPSQPSTESKEELTSEKKKATKRKRKVDKPELLQEHSSPVIENIEKWDERTTLMEIFKQEPNPSRQMTKEIAKVLKKRQGRVSRFFSNQRNKEKNSGKYSHVTPEIRLKLEEEFKVNQNLTTERKKEVAAANNLQLKTVTTWFFSRRMKEKDPENWKKMKAKYRADSKRRLRLESNKPLQFKYSEEQKNFMNGKVSEGHEITKEQSREWAKEINLNEYQAARRRRPRARTPLTEEEAIPIIGKVLKENPNYRECGNGVLINTLFWSKPKVGFQCFIELTTSSIQINYYICQNPLNEGKLRKTPDSRVKLTQPVMETIESAFERNPFFSASQMKAWGKEFNLKPQAFHTFAFYSRTKILKKYLAQGEYIDTLPTTMRLLETEYLKSTCIQSVTEAARIVDMTKVEFRNALGYFSMRRRLDRERGIDVIKEEDVPKILYKDVRKNQKKTAESVVKLTQPVMETIVPAFERNPFFSAPQVEAWGKEFNLKPKTLYMFGFKKRTRILKKYLSEGQKIDTLPTTMRLLEMEYLRSNFIESVTEAAGIVDRTKVKFCNALGYFSMRRRLDRERGVDVIKEEDVPKILNKHVKKNQKKNQKTPELVERVKLEEPDYDELVYQPPVNVIKQEDFDDSAATSNRQAGEEDNNDESDDASDSEDFDSEWSSDNPLSSDDDDNEEAFVNMLRVPKKEEIE